MAYVAFNHLIICGFSSALRYMSGQTKLHYNIFIIFICSLCECGTLLDLNIKRLVSVRTAVGAYFIENVLYIYILYIIQLMDEASCSSSVSSSNSWRILARVEVLEGNHSCPLCTAFISLLLIDWSPLCFLKYWIYYFKSHWKALFQYAQHSSQITDSVRATTHKQLGFNLDLYEGFQITS